ncbi:hypothetical protein OSK93_23595, partial [Escherichia coli]|nr:hypothetical protein [Escherichia coli]
ENLRLVHDHMKYEAVGNIQGVLTTLCSSPVYHFYVPGFTDIDGAGSQKPVELFYEIAKGIQVDDPDAYYAAACRMLLTWPRHATEPKLTGEEAWVDRDMFEGIASRKVTNIIDADPGDEWRVQ